MLEVHQFYKTYPQGFNLSIPSLHLDKGIHLIKGENGSGKSTLLKAIAGIHRFEGEIILDGTSLKKQPIPYRRLVNYSDAEPLFPEFLSLDELIQFVAQAKEGPADQVRLLKELFGVTGYSSNPISTYSSGMLKKSGLLLAFLGKPSLIILDEPFTTIDALSQKLLRDLISNQASSGVGFLITSHLADSSELFDYGSILTVSGGNLYSG